MYHGEFPVIAWLGPWVAAQGVGIDISGQHGASLPTRWSQARGLPDSFQNPKRAVVFETLHLKVKSWSNFKHEQENTSCETLKFLGR